MEGRIMTDIRTSLLGGSSSANNFSISIVGNVTTTTLSSNYPAGKYAISSVFADSSIDTYAYNSSGTLVGTSSELTLTTTGEFNKLVILGGTASDIISFSYNQSGFVSTSTSNETTAAAVISSINPAFVNTVNAELYIEGSNFASNVAVYFKGTDGVERAADSVTRNSSTSLTITSPDTLPTGYSPYSIIVENPGVARPTVSNYHILQDGINAAGTNIGWTRPSDWIALTAPESNEQKFVGLLGISNDDSNYVALLAQGNYTVDWGDGSAPENFTSNTKASHKYTYSSISSTVTSEGFKQVIVTVTPQAGQNLTALDLQQTYTRTNLTTNAQILWLDIAIAGTNLTTIKLTGATSPTFRMSYLQRVNIVSSGLTSYAYLFANCTKLKNVSFSSNSTITNTSYMFYNCLALESVPLFNTSSVTNMSYMFNSCISLESVPLFNTSSVTNMSNMFAFCYCLKYVPTFVTNYVNNMGNMFSGCISLKTVPLFNTDLVSDMSYMFDGCNMLESVPLFNTSSVTNMSSMFSSCSSLKTVPLFNTSSVTNMTSMFSGCSSLESVPLFNTSSVTIMSSMFSGCSSLKTVPLFNTSSVTGMSSMFSGCISLESVPLFNTSSVTSMSSMFSTCYSLKSAPLFDTASVTNMTSMFSSCVSLKTVPLFNTSSVTSMSSMFSGCLSLNYVPLFNTSSVTNMSGMFTNCMSLKTIPSFNMASIVGIGLQSFAGNTISLENLTLNNSAITSISSLLYSTSVTYSPGVFNFPFSTSSVRALKSLSVNCTGVTAAPTSVFISGAFTNLSSVILTGMKYAIDVSGMRLDGTALNALYTSLGTAAGAQTITVTNNHGTVDDTPSIATAKGWTVTGS